MSHFEKQLDSKVVFEGKIISVRHDTVELENGKQGLREVIAHPGAVVILAVDKGEAFFVKQYRYAVGRELLEVPAGKLEYGEDHRDAALRELREETGASCERLIYMGQVYPTPGVYNEIFHMYFADGLSYGEQDPDEDEFLTAVKIPLDEYGRMIASGEANDAKSICIYTMAKARGLI
ncbi:MAG: NUDIX hydrolase [Clostridia bacterium]|nr:NUDIX hydrolase [Clostridia bacterium]MBQ9966335.1 NUDIX hydrolase [Clostridia bacterium]